MALNDIFEWQPTVEEIQKILSVPPMSDELKSKVKRLPSRKIELTHIYLPGESEWVLAVHLKSFSSSVPYLVGQFGVIKNEIIVEDYAFYGLSGV